MMMMMMMLLLMMKMMMIIMIMALKGANHLLTAPRAVSNTYTQVTRAQSCAITCNMRALITFCMSCATFFEGTAQLLNLTDFK